MESGKSENNRCSAVTNSGTRCKRSAEKFGRYCKQHSAMLQESLWGHHGELSYIPDAPPVLSQMAAGYWHQYCRELMQHKKLRGHYLSELFELCRRHDYRKELEKLMEQHGLINEYDNGVQLSGIDKVLDRNDKRITDLKKQFGLTLDSEKKLKGEASSTQEKPKKSTLRKHKAW